MPADVYIQRRFDSVLYEVFEGRRKLEKYLSRADLLAYDQVLARYLKKDIIIEKIRREAYFDYNVLSQAGQELDQIEDKKNSDEIQGMKMRNHQLSFSQVIKNEDAIYKFIAYTGVLEKNRREKRDETKSNPILAQGGDTFE